MECSPEDLERCCSNVQGNIPEKLKREHDLLPQKKDELCDLGKAEHCQLV